MSISVYNAMRSLRPLSLAATTKCPAPIAKLKGWSDSCQPADLRAVEVSRLLQVRPAVRPVRVPIAAPATEFSTG